MMGVDTDGVLLSNCKDVFLIAEKIGIAILENRPKPQGLRLQGSPNCSFYPGLSHMLSMSFKWGEEDRALKIHFDCDSDLKLHEELNGLHDGKAIFFSLGMWGSSVEIMQVVLSAVKGLGKVMIDKNDCDDVGYEEA